MKNIKCRNCFFYRNEWCEKIVDSPDPEEARDCNYFREMTNADRIRAMSDEELGVWICKHALSCGCCVGAELCRRDDGIANGAVKWLQMQAEVDDHSICGATNLPCIRCNPGGCDNRKEGADNDT